MIKPKQTPVISTPETDREFRDYAFSKLLSMTTLEHERILRGADNIADYVNKHLIPKRFNRKINHELVVRWIKQGMPAVVYEQTVQSARPWSWAINVGSLVLWLWKNGSLRTAVRPWRQRPRMNRPARAHRNKHPMRGKKASKRKG